ncbi:MAG: hypothetical protein ACYCPV_02780 [Thermoplasmata archaeon]
MSAGPSPRKWSRRWEEGLRTYRALVADFILAVGIFLTVLVVGYFTPLSTVGPFPAINAVTATPTTNYNLLFAVLGPILVIIGGYMAGAYYFARLRFEHLMRTRSKAEFLRNIPELEEALAELTPADELRYAQRLGELRIRR